MSHSVRSLPADSVVQSAHLAFMMKSRAEATGQRDGGARNVDDTEEADQKGPIYESISPRRIEER
jgi:hypothetical protein